MSRKIEKVGLFASISLLILGGLCPNSAKAISADEYKSSVSKKIIELDFDVPKVSAYVIKLVNTSSQSLSCKIQAYNMIGLLDGLSQSKAMMQNLQPVDTSRMDARMKQKFEESRENAMRSSSESSFQILDKNLRITDSICK